MNIPFPLYDEPVRRKFTVDDVLSMIDAGILREDENVELIEGELIMMAAKYAPHENIKHALNLALARSIGEELYVAIESSLRLNDDTIVEPDITVIARELYKTTRRLVEPRPEHVRLLIEIAASSLTYDRKVKARLYARHGIREFWVIDPKERLTWIHTGPQGDGWSAIVERKPEEVLSTPALPGFSIKLQDV